MHILPFGTPEQCFLLDLVLSVWPECGPQPQNDSDPLEEKQTLFIQKFLSLGSHISRAEAKEIVMA